MEANEFTTDELTTFELAQQIGVCEATVQRWCRTGRIPGSHLGIRHGRVTWLIPNQAVNFTRLRRRGTEEQNESD